MLLYSGVNIFVEKQPTGLHEVDFVIRKSRD